MSPNNLRIEKNSIWIENENDNEMGNTDKGDSEGNDALGRNQTERADFYFIGAWWAGKEL